MTNPPNSQADPDATLTTCMQDLDDVFAMSAQVINRRRTTPEPGDEELLARLSRLHKALRRRLKGITPASSSRRPGPPPKEGFTKGMEWATGNDDEGPPTPPEGFTWSVSLEDNLQIRVYTLIDAEVISPEDLAVDAELLAKWDAHRAAHRLPDSLN